MEFENDDVEKYSFVTKVHGCIPVGEIPSITRLSSDKNRVNVYEFVGYSVYVRVDMAIQVHSIWYWMRGRSFLLLEK